MYGTNGYIQLCQSKKVSAEDNCPGPKKTRDIVVQAFRGKVQIWALLVSNRALSQRITTRSVVSKITIYLLSFNS